MTSQIRRRLLATTLLVSASVAAQPAWAQQDSTMGPPIAPGQAQEPILGDQPNDAIDESATDTQNAEIVVTGSRIARPNLTSNSPVAVVTGEETVEHADITLETFLNTLPQVNPAGTTTSNNPGNGGQANINLRGLGANRNLILLNGRRPMVSGTDQTVDVNTIPQALIERIEVVTGGAGAIYGADAIAGVVNIILKDDFEGIDIRGIYSQSIPEMDSRDFQISGVIGGNFADGRGNVAFAVDYSKREGLIKAQRPFAAQATSTTGTFPTGRFTPVNSFTCPAGATFCTPGQTVGGNPIPQDAINALFASYGVDPKDFPTQSLLSFNTDGSLFGVGTFNNPRDVANFRYPLGDLGAAPNLNYFPDFYTYNFDIVNLLVLPLERKSAFMRANYEMSPAAEVFVQAGYTEYSSISALAPTPVGVTIRAPGENSDIQAFTPLLIPGTGARATGFVVPASNPFIPADFRTLLNTRTGDDPRFAGAGADEAFPIGYRFLGTGLREQEFDNQVLQGLVGLRGEITPGIRYETYYSWGRTIIDQEARGNVNVQRVQELLESPDGGADICEGGFNPVGIQPISEECVEYVNETGFTSTKFTQNIAQGFITADLAELPAGTLQVVVGAEHRSFDYDFDPGALFGPIAGFNTSVPAGGSNTFTDFFGEILIPILRDQPWADQLELSLQARHSTSDFNDVVNDVDGEPQDSLAYGATLSYAPFPDLRFRASYQHSVRAPNFGELFSGGGSFPQIFDPCSVGSNFRDAGGDEARAICETAGLVGGLGPQVDTFVATPGAQAFISYVGNTRLEPEESDTFTLGAVFNAFGFTGSLDYYNIKINDPIFAPDPNLIIAACYGFHGVNPDLDPDNEYCGTLFRSGGNIAAIAGIPESIGGDPDTGYFTVVNQGSVKTSGIDFQLGYRLPTEFIAQRSALSLNLFVNYLIDFEVEELPGVEIDYAGTASYFGAGLGTSFPRWKGVLNAALSLDPFTIETRLRYIHGMENRAARQFPGEEASFTGPDSIIYTDVAIETNIDAMTFRLGINNLFDLDPPVYAPNVQSGTDPSLYDVIGRRAYVSARLKF